MRKSGSSCATPRPSRVRQLRPCSAVKDACRRRLGRMTSRCGAAVCGAAVERQEDEAEELDVNVELESQMQAERDRQMRALARDALATIDPLAAFPSSSLLCALTNTTQRAAAGCAGGVESVARLMGCAAPHVIELLKLEERCKQWYPFSETQLKDYFTSLGAELATSLQRCTAGAPEGDGDGGEGGGDGSGGGGGGAELAAAVEEKLKTLRDATLGVDIEDEGASGLPSIFRSQAPGSSNVFVVGTIDLSDL